MPTLTTPTCQEYQEMLAAFIIVVKRQCQSGHVPTALELDELASDFRSVFEGRKEVNHPITVQSTIDRLNFIRFFHQWS